MDPAPTFRERTAVSTSPFGSALVVGFAASLRSRLVWASQGHANETCLISTPRLHRDSRRTSRLRRLAPNRLLSLGASQHFCLRRALRPAAVPAPLLRSGCFETLVTLRSDSTHPWSNAPHADTFASKIWPMKTGLRCSRYSMVTSSRRRLRPRSPLSSEPGWRSMRGGTRASNQRSNLGLSPPTMFGQ